MSIDKKIQDALRSESEDLEAIVNHDPGLFTMLTNSFRGSMARWMYISSVFALFFSVAFIWCGYEFYVAEELMERVFWGVCFLAGLFIQALIKLWTFMEVNRNSLIREMKRLELLISRALAEEA